MRDTEPVLIIGGGIGGLTLALALARAGIACRVYETAAELLPLGAGINLLPHATAALDRLGVLADLEAIAVETRESAFFNRFGQTIYREPAGRFAGAAHPQLSIHRGDLQSVLQRHVRERLGDDALVLGTACSGATSDARGATAHLRHVASGGAFDVHGRAVIGCDGIWSALRKQYYPDEGPPKYTGVTMWRGVTVWEPFLTGASMVRAGWLSGGKMVIYPIRNAVDAAGRQLVNWVAEVELPQRGDRDWSRAGKLDDFLPCFADWTFDWLDVPALLRGAATVLEYPMVDQEPLPRWTFDNVTLLGDAAHPMVPRGSNGAAQAILDAVALSDALARDGDSARALSAYDEQRREATAAIVRLNRTQPPDAILREVYERTGDRLFTNIDDVIPPAELAAIADGYRAVAGVTLPGTPGARPRSPGAPDAFPP